MDYPWYETLTNSDEVRQGDFILECPIIIPPETLDFNANEIAFNETLTIQAFNTVVVSQSCDLENGKLDIVLVCPYYSLEQFFEGRPPSDQTGNGRKKILTHLKQGNYPSYHLLNRDEDIGLSEYCIVDFRNVYGVNFQFLKTYAATFASRIRLLPPYREHLSQAFARFFMRVGLPHDIQGLV